MQQIMALMRQRLAKKLFVNLLNLRVLMGTAHKTLLIIRIKTGHTLGPHFLIGEIRLTAAADAPALAGHDFDEMIGRIFALLSGFPSLHS